MFELGLTGAWAVLAALVLLPGLVAGLVWAQLSDTEERSVQRLLLGAAVFDCLIYPLLFAMKPLGLTPYPGKEPFNALTVVAAFLLAIALGVVGGAGTSNGVWRRILYRVGLTKKGPRNVWVDGFQHAEGAWAYVHLKDGRRILGVPLFYSSKPGESAVYLVRGAEADEPVLIYDQNGNNPVPQNGPGVLVTPSAGITLVSFLGGLPAD